MIILGIDPGTNITGYGIISFDKNNLVRICSGLIKLPSRHPLPQRLQIIYDEINNIIKIYSPDEFAIETAFYGKNIQSAMKIGYARGVSLLAAVHNNLPCSEYSPREIKQAVVGNGSASKEQVYYMINNLLAMQNEKMKLDESDALAAAVCHAFRFKKVKSRSKSWKSFIDSFPERVI
jgi:crossover junction endodeoxyribonuclease RuvC